MPKPKEKPLADKECRAFVDNLPEDQVSPKTKETLEDVIARTAAAIKAGNTGF